MSDIKTEEFDYVIVCMICFEPLTTSTDVVATACGHVFHRQCLMDWEKQKQECPKCRSEKPKQFKICLDFDTFPEYKKLLQEVDVLKQKNMILKQLLTEKMEQESGEAAKELSDFLKDLCI